MEIASVRSMVDVSMIDRLGSAESTIPSGPKITSFTSFADGRHKKIKWQFWAMFETELAMIMSSPSSLLVASGSAS